MKNKKIIVFVALLIVAVLIFVFRGKLFGANSKSKTEIPNQQNNNSSSKFLLKKGSRGDQVKLIQAYLNEFYGFNIMVDGIWGDKTQTAFEAFSKNVDFVSSTQGITTKEYKFFEPQFNYLSKKYFTKK